jgi:hypothetical protein
MAWSSSEKKAVKISLPGSSRRTQYLEFGPRL